MAPNLNFFECRSTRIASNTAPKGRKILTSPGRKPGGRVDRSVSNKPQRGDTRTQEHFRKIACRPLRGLSKFRSNYIPQLALWARKAFRPFGACTSSTLDFRVGCHVRNGCRQWRVAWSTLAWPCICSARLDCSGVPRIAYPRKHKPAVRLCVLGCCNTHEYTCSRRLKPCRAGTARRERVKRSIFYYSPAISTISTGVDTDHDASNQPSLVGQRPTYMARIASNTAPKGRKILTSPGRKPGGRVDRSSSNKPQRGDTTTLEHFRKTECRPSGA